MPNRNQDNLPELTRAKTVFNELSPAYINFCLGFSGHGAADLDQPFTYAELGSGWSLSTIAWAVNYPQGRFFSIDPAQGPGAWAQKLTKEAELDNISIFERSIGEMLNEDLPQMDYIALQGLYSRVGPQGRDDIKKFIMKFLKPGGVVSVGYNAQPGWSAATPLMDFLITAAQVAGGQAQVTLRQSLNSLKAMEEAGALYFKNSENAGQWLQRWLSIDPGFLAGEILSLDRRPFSFSEIVEEMSEAQVGFAGSLEIYNYLDSVITPKPFLDCLNQVAGSLVLRETVKGLLYNTSFRNDLFMKDTRPLDREKAEESINKKRLALCGEKLPMPEKVVIRGIELSPKGEVYNPIIEFLDQGPATIAEIREKTGLDTAQVAQASAILAAMGWAHPAPPDCSPEMAERVKKFNLVLDNYLGAEPFNQVLTVFGQWRGLSALERLYVIATLNERDPESFILEVCGKRGWKVLKDNEEITDPEVAHQVVSEQIQKIKSAAWVNRRFWGQAD